MSGGRFMRKGIIPNITCIGYKYFDSIHHCMTDIIVIGVVAGTILLWGGAVVFFFGVRKERNTKFKKTKSKE